MSYGAHLRQTHRSARQWHACRSVADIATLIGIPEHQLQFAALQPSYQLFKLPKTDGTFRSIEAPTGTLKDILQKLNGYLQCCYYSCKTSAAYGYVICLDDDPDVRNIVTNAKRHLGKPYLLNVDLDDFFHQVTSNRIEAIFSKAPFRKDKKLSAWLTAVSTLHGRLPMGSPTSPVLSNFATTALDGELSTFALREGIVYTRYVDDLSFSREAIITERHFEEIRDILYSHRFLPDLKKIKWYDSDADKMITGLLVGDTIRIPQAFLDNLTADLSRLKNTLEVQSAFGPRGETPWLLEFEQQLSGKLNFLTLVYGKGSDMVQHYQHLLRDAYRTQEYLESRSWLDFNYQW